MADPVVDVSSLNATQKLALMEQLWESMSRADELTEPPAWHGDVLQERESEWAQRNSTAQDWAEAKDEIRDKLK